MSVSYPDSCVNVCVGKCLMGNGDCLFPVQELHFPASGNYKSHK